MFLQHACIVVALKLHNLGLKKANQSQKLLLRTFDDFFSKFYELAEEKLLQLIKTRPHYVMGILKMRKSHRIMNIRVALNKKIVVK